MKKIMFLMMSLMMMSFGAMADSSPTSTATPTNGATHCDKEPTDGKRPGFDSQEVEDVSGGTSGSQVDG